MPQCCKAKTKWKIEETKWRIVFEGTNKSGIYTGAQKGNPPDETDPDDPKAYYWRIVEPETLPIFSQEIEKVPWTVVRKKKISGPSGGNCINTKGGNIIKETMISPSRITYGPSNITTRVNNSGPTYWASERPSSKTKWYGGYETFRYGRVVYEEIWEQEWEAENDAGKKADCCTPSSEIPNIFDKFAKWQSWIAAQ